MIKTPPATKWRPPPPAFAEAKLLASRRQALKLWGGFHIFIILKQLPSPEYNEGEGRPIGPGRGLYFQKLLEHLKTIESRLDLVRIGAFQRHDIGQDGLAALILL